MKVTLNSWTRVVFCILGGVSLAMPTCAVAACWGDGDVVAEYLFYDDGDGTAINTGIDEDDGNAVLVNGASFNTNTPPSNGDCGWSVKFPGSGSGSTTPAAETEDFYDPLGGTSNFTILAWIRRESGSVSSNTSARIVSDTSSLTLTNTTAGVELRLSGSSGALYLRINGYEVGTTSAGIPPNSDQWTHVAVVFDGTRPATNTLTRNIHFYVNGIQRGDGNTLQNVVVGDNTNRLTMGNSSVSRGIANTLVGKMDDVIIMAGVAPAAVGNGKTNETIQCYMNLNDDIVRPVIYPPANVTTNTDPGQCYSTNVNLGQPSVSDNCGVASIDNNAPTVFASGVTLVVWTATDYAGNPSTCTQAVTVVDGEDPVITCPSNITAEAGHCLAAVTNLDLGEPVVSDNCGVTMVSSNAPAAFSVGTTYVVWQAVDAADNHGTCTQEVSVLPSQTLDCDGDGLADYEELMIYFTDPEDPCTADDGLSDGWKVQYGFNPTSAVPVECRPRYW